MKIESQQVAVITGGGSGIGAALARACALQGMQVVVADIDKRAADSIVAELEMFDAKALAVQVDIADEGSVQALADITREAFGDCHLLCNNAGVCINRSFADSTKADWDWVMSVNVMGTVNSLNAFLPGMLKAGGARHIVNTASLTGLVAIEAVGSVYTASKYALIGMSEILQQELAQTEVGVTILCPGAVNTRILESERNRPDSSATAETAPVPGGLDESFVRMIEPVDVAAMVLDAVRDNKLYVVTHPEWFPMIEQRVKLLESAFKD